MQSSATAILDFPAVLYQLHFRPAVLQQQLDFCTIDMVEFPLSSDRTAEILNVFLWLKRKTLVRAHSKLLSTFKARLEIAFEDLTSAILLDSSAKHT